LGKAKHYEEAVFACTNAISTAKNEDPLLASLYFNRATMYAHLDDYQAAIKDLKEVLRINPNHKNAKQFMGGLEREVQKRGQQQ
jgi:tetratricopeptide (TPR) repeat protein